MTTADIMLKLEAFGSAQTKKVLMRHGAREPFFGVKVEDLKKIVKEVKSFKKPGEAIPLKHRLALELYSTGNSDAMYLAGLLAEPKLMDKSTLQSWAEGAYWHMISDYTVAWVASESRYGWELGLEWIRSDQEFIASAGWCTLGSLVSLLPDQQLDIPKLRDLTEEIGRTLPGSKNRVRYSMNNFLIALACFVPELTETCKKIGQQIGVVTVDMGGTACKVPFAPDYIAKVEQRGRIGVKRKSAIC